MIEAIVIQTKKGKKNPELCMLMKYDVLQVLLLRVTLDCIDCLDYKMIQSNL